MRTPSSPGWYENPDNPEELRYFDGILWTAHTTPLRTVQAPTQAPDQQTPQQQQPTQQQAPQYPPPQAPQYPTPHQHQQNPYGQPTRAGLPGQVVLASYGMRVLAYILDAIIIGAISLVLGGWFLWKALEPVFERFDTAMASGDVEAMSTVIEEARLGYLAAFIGVQLLILLAYQVLCLTRWSATPGKLTVGIHVRRLDRPGVLDFDTAVRRSGFQAVLQAIGNVPLLSLFGTIATITDLVWPLADERKQALHDKVAKTIVVRGRVQR